VLQPQKKKKKKEEEEGEDSSLFNFKIIPLSTFDLFRSLLPASRYT